MKRVLGALVILLSTIDARAAVSGTTTLYDAGAPPWFKGTAPAATAKVAWIAVRVAPNPLGAPEGWLPRAALEALALDLTKRLASRTDIALAKIGLPDDGRPQARLGCAGESEIGDDLGESCDPDQRATHLAITQSSKKWRGTFASVFPPLEADYLLLVDLAVRDRWLAQKGMSFRKEVPLGTAYAQPAPWLTSLDTPVSVLQLEGVLVGRDGKVVRSGVEGIFATRTRFGESVLGLQRVLTEDDVASVRTDLRRGDAPDAPLAWEAALDALVRGLASR